MGRAPCCEKMGLKKGPWTREEDLTLTGYISRHGHGNWRALPKLAGLLRCGKSCRLRWINYLRPDIKRGNFAPEEEETIINLHAAMGNRWSAIAARLPGRTDNEIKNVWHTHLKKRVTKVNVAQETKTSTISSLSKVEQELEQAKQIEARQVNLSTSQTSTTFQDDSAQDSFTDISSSFTTTTSDNENNSNCMNSDILPLDDFPEVDEKFWLELFSDDQKSHETSYQVDHGDIQLQFLFDGIANGSHYGSNSREDMDFWYDIFTRAEDIPELPHF